jgi:GrpB-like predicted nucleotidyltransferase (UPF0157 family)
MTFLRKLFKSGHRNDHSADLARSATPFAGQHHSPLPVTIVPHNAHWTQVYSDERQRLLKALRGVGAVARQVVGIEHIGSTSVPGLHAKPVVDLMIGVRDVNDLRTFPVAALAKLGYVLRPFTRPPNSAGKHPAPSIPRLFLSKYTAPAVNVHVFVYNDAHWRGHLAVRDYLRTHPNMARVYQHVKQSFAAHYAHNLRAYGRAKRPFLNSLERLAERPPTKATPHLVTPVIAPRPLPPPDPSPHPHPAPPSPPQPVYLGDPDGWQVNVWYQRQPDGTYQPSSDQHPDSDGAVGIFVEYLGLQDDGNYAFSIMSRGDASNGTPNDPTVGNAPPPNLVVPDASSVIYIVTGEENGKEMTMVVLSANFTDFPIPENATVIANTDGTYVIKYYNDGSPWLDDNAGDTNSGSQGDDSGDTGTDDGSSDGDDENASPYDNR